MPWTSKDAHRHTHKATSPKQQRQWEHVANIALQRTGNEGLAVREANGVIARHHAAGGMVRPPAPTRPFQPPVLGHAQSPLGIAIQNKGNAGRYAGGMGLAPARPPRVPIGGMLRNIDQGLGKTKARLMALGGSLGQPTPAQQSPAGLDPRTLQVVQTALEHLRGMDASSAAAVLGSSPEAMSHPEIAAVAHALRTASGITPATKTLNQLSQAGSASSGQPMQRLLPPLGNPAGATPQGAGQPQSPPGMQSPPQSGGGASSPQPTNRSGAP